MDDTAISTDGERVSPEDDEWLKMAADAHTQSTDWFDASVRPVVEKAMAHFSGRHAPGSKYHSESYKYRSKGFRPKTRASIRRNEAAAAVAFFSTQDLVSVTAENQSDPMQVASAAIQSELLNYRLSDSIAWFPTLIGAYQNCLNVGVAISHQSWEYDEETNEQPYMDDLGNPIMGEDGEQPVTQTRSVVTDKPRIDLVAIENFRISPASSWTDPVGTSPYIIEMIPMFIGDIKEKMESGKWIKYESGEIKTAAANQYDSIRAARDGSKRQDGLDITYATSDFDTVFVHRNIIRKDGIDVIFYTLGTHLRLSEPKPLREEYLHLRKGERPYVIGSCLIETHKPLPAGLNELTFNLQEETNEIQNQRRDNVSLVMNRRYFARRGANVDFKSLTRNVPGSVTLVDDINGDIRWDSPIDITQSSYAEQDRVNTDYDELAGTFSPGSVQTNRKLNETVGGMELLAGDANVITEYQLRVFSETWVMPVLKQLARMEVAYETDETVLAIAGQRSKMLQRFGMSQVTDDLLREVATVNVNVGFGATNPTQRVQKLMMGLQSVAGIAPQLMGGINAKEVVIEVFGALGYKSAERFFPKMDEPQAPPAPPPDPRIQVAQMQIQAKAQEQQAKIKADADHAAADYAFQKWAKEQDIQLGQANLTAEQQQAFDKHKVDLATLSMKLRTQTALSEQSIAHGRDTTVGQHMMDLHKSKQALAPPTEPAGRAESGKAFTQ